MAAIVLVEFDPGVDVEPLVAFLTGNTFPFHLRSTVGDADARATVLDGRYWSDDVLGCWIEVDGERVGIVAIDGIDDIADGGNPELDLRLAETHRGRGLGAPVLQAVTDLVFTRWPLVARFEGSTREDNLAMRATFRRAGWVKEAYHRDAWPVEGSPPTASVAYAILRRDWESGTTTPVVWDDR